MNERVLAARICSLLSVSDSCHPLCRGQGLDLHLKAAWLIRLLGQCVKTDCAELGRQSKSINSSPAASMKHWRVTSIERQMQCLVFAASGTQPQPDQKPCSMISCHGKTGFMGKNLKELHSWQREWSHSNNWFEPTLWANKVPQHLIMSSGHPDSASHLSHNVPAACFRQSTGTASVETERVIK